MLPKTRRFWFFLVTLTLVGCRANQTPQNSATPTQETSAQTPTAVPLTWKFKDVTQSAGIDFRHNNGSFGASLLPETMGSGAIWFDYDGDGYPDLFFVNGRDWTKTEVEQYRHSPISAVEAQFLADNRGKTSDPLPREAKLKPYHRTTGALYHNNGNGTFRDVTLSSGLDAEMQGMGAASADYDGDGRPDLCLTSYGKLFLFRNLGGGRFKDVSAQVGLQDSAWSTSAAWVDYDRDGYLDLFICRYAQWTPSTDIFTALDKKHKSYGWPKDYKSQTCRLFRNIGGKRFQDVSVKAGISQVIKTGSPLLGAALGITVCDLNRDNWPDLMVSNDLRPNFFFLNARKGTFIEDAVGSGLATGVTGRPRGGMGIDTADIDHSGRDSIAIGHFNADVMGLWQGDGQGTFQDIAQKTEIGSVSANLLTFGLLFVDVNNDGWPDLLAANGHVDPTVHNFLMLVNYEEPAVLFLNRTAQEGGVGKPQFQNVAAQVGLGTPIVGRGLCVADYDLDGDLDVLITTSAGRPLLMRNDGGNANRSIRLILRGKAPNQEGIGAHVKAVIGKETVRRDVRTGSSYLSQNEIPLTIGLGKSNKIDLLTIRWPDNTKTEWKDLATNQILTVSEDGKVLSRRAFPDSKK